MPNLAIPPPSQTKRRGILPTNRAPSERRRAAFGNIPNTPRRVVFILNRRLTERKLPTERNALTDPITIPFVFRSAPPASVDEKKSRRPTRGRRQTKLEPEKPLKPLPHSFKGECGASCLSARSTSLKIIHDPPPFCKRFFAFSDFSAQVTKRRLSFWLFHILLHTQNAYYSHIKCIIRIKAIF